MIINIQYDQSTSRLPSGFTNDVSAVVNYLTSQFTDNLTFTLHVGYGEVDGSSLGSTALGESITFFNSFSYSAIRAALINDASTADDFTAVATLPATDPITGTHTDWVAQTEAVALGLLPTSTAISMYVGFSNMASFDYDRSNGITAGAYDFFGTVAHEITEVMGRELGVGENLINNAPTDYISDLFHYSSPGVRDSSPGGYLSIDGGNTSLGAFNSVSGGDLGDLASSAGNDAFLAFSSPGVVNDVSPSDLRWMDILGYNRVVSPATVGVRDAYVSENGAIAGSSLIVSVSNPTGDNLTAYEFIDQGTAGGHFVLNGVVQAANQTITVPVGSLGSLQYVGGTAPGAETIAVGVFDATTNTVSNFSTLTATTVQPLVTDPTFSLSAFGVQNTWTSQTQYPRAVGDINGDGKADIVGFGYSGVYESLSTGGGNFTNVSLGIGGSFSYANGWTSQDQYPRMLADVNGDGKADIIGFGDGGVYEALATGGGNFAAPQLILAGSFGYQNSWTSQNQYPRMLADVNGDGKADIVGFGSNGVYESLATGGGGFAGPQLILPGSFGYQNSWTSQDQFPRFLADVNGDGMADIIGFGYSGVYESLATGGGTFGAPTLVLPGSFSYANGWTSENQYPRMLADVNGDGKADIVGFGDDGVWVALATGGGNFASPQFVGSEYGLGTSWSSQDLYPRALGDVTGDGRADIVGFASAGVYTSQFHL